ncbi:MAG: AI-2E family transporter [Porcipelethomonas sp.]
MNKKFSFSSNRLAKTIVYSGAILIIIAFVILRYEGFFAIISKVMNILRPIILGCIIAFALNRPLNFFHIRFRKLFTGIRNSVLKSRKKPVSDKMVSGKAPFACACFTTYLVTIAVMTGIICFIIPQISDSFVLFKENINSYTDNLNNLLNSGKFRINEIISSKIDFNKFIEQINEKLASLSEYIPTVISKTYDITSSIISVVVDLVLGCVFSVYILMDKKNLKKHAKFLSRLVLKEKHYPKFEKIMAMSYNTFANFISGQITEAVILGIMCFFGMTILRFEYAPLISVIIGITNMIPVAGPILGTIPCALLLLLVNPVHAVWFVVFVIVIQQIDSNLIYPKVVGNSVGLPALWVLAAITVGGGLGGVIGMVLGVPVVSIIYAMIKEKLDSEGSDADETLKS